MRMKRRQVMRHRENNVRHDDQRGGASGGQRTKCDQRDGQHDQRRSDDEHGVRNRVEHPVLRVLASGVSVADIKTTPSLIVRSQSGSLDLRGGALHPPVCFSICAAAASTTSSRHGCATT